MKFLFLLTYYYPHWTGLTQYAQRLAEGLAKKNQVTVLTAKHNPNLKTEESINSVNVKRKSVLFRLSRTLISFELILSFFKEILKSEAVVIYLPYADVLLTSIITKIFGKKLYLVHNGDLTLPSGFFNRFLEAVYNLTSKYAIVLSNKTIVQTDDYLKSSRLLFPLRPKISVVLPLFADYQNKKNPVKNIKDNAEIQLSQFSGYKKVGFAGRFVEEKGFDILLSSIPLVLRDYPKTQFVYAGEVKMIYEQFFEKNQDLVEQSQNNLIFLGRLDKDGMAAFYKNIDLLVISSRSDCFPSVGVEAMLSGVPVVVTDIPGARWPVKVTGMGIIVEKENPKKLASGIIKGLKIRNKLIQNKAKAEKIFNYNTTLSKYEKIFKE